MLPAIAQAEAFIGNVIGVTDGDTITVVDASKHQYKVRLGGIDAPEKGQPFGTASKRNLSELVYEKEVRVEGSKVDRYGRLIGKVWVRPEDCRKCGQTLDANLAQVTTGMAWWYRQYASEQSLEDQGRYEFAEVEAMARHAGLWKDSGPVPPWEWRHASKGAALLPAMADTSSSQSCNIKGNINSKGRRIYHVPGQEHYGETQINESRGERWFCSEGEARAAGWRAAKR